VFGQAEPTDGDDFDDEEESVLTDERPQQNNANSGDDDDDDEDDDEPPAKASNKHIGIGIGYYNAVRYRLSPRNFHLGFSVSIFVRLL
jgi:hypothetical protein